jgi:hypothetical protein
LVWAVLCSWMEVPQSMDRQRLEDLVEAAVARGIAEQPLITKIRNATTIREGRTSVDSLLRTYRRRLRYTGGDMSLFAMTQDLVDFLDTCEREHLSMIYISGPGRYYTFLLADLETSEILHWMRMFGRQDAKRTLDNPDDMTPPDANVHKLPAPPNPGQLQIREH